MKESTRLVAKVPKEQFNKFKFLCKIKNLTQKKIINDYINFFINKFWTPEINNLYIDKK